MLESVAKDFDKKTENENTTQMLNRMIKIIEDVVVSVFEKKEDFKSEEEKSRRGNMIPRKVRLLMKKKRSISDNILKSKSGTKTRKLMQSLEAVEKTLEENQRMWKRKKENEALSKIKRNPKYFYTYANKHSKLKNKVGPLVNEDEETVKENFEMAELLRKQYESTFSHPQPEEVEEEEVEEVEEVEEEEVEAVDQEDPVVLADIPFTLVDMAEAINSLSLNSGPGPDGVPAIVLKKAKTTVAMMMSTIMRSSMDSGDIPDILRSSFICPQLKPNSQRERPASWRPINLTSHIVKTWERVVRKGTVNYLEVNNLMDPNQHGARQRRSCLSQLLEHYDETLKMLETGANVDVLYTDFEKAFEKVNHKTLITKMETKFKVKGKVLRWFKSFLKNRTQQVLIEGTKSKPSKVVSGCVQGSVFGPVIFLMFVSDMGEELETKPKLFVDDAKVKEKIESDEDVENMQNNLEKLYKWQNDNDMKFNGKKFQVLRYGPNEDLKNRTMYFTENMENVIEQFPELRDLGIILSDDAKFTKHVDKVVKTVRQKAGWIMRTFLTRQTDVMKQLWKTLLQPHIDFCSQLYKPGQAQDLLRIEKLFYDYSAKIPEIRDKDYWSRLSHLKMLSQERRMERYRIIYVWKILHGLAPNCGVELVQTNKRQGRRCAVPSLLAGGRAAIQTLREQSFQVDGPRLFNALPKSLRELKGTQEEFKEALDTFLMTVPDHPRMGSQAPEAVDQRTGRQSNSLLAWATWSTN